MQARGEERRAQSGHGSVCAEMGIDHQCTHVSPQEEGSSSNFPEGRSTGEPFVVRQATAAGKNAGRQTTVAGRIHMVGVRRIMAAIPPPAELRATTDGRQACHRDTNAP